MKDILRVGLWGSPFPRGYSVSLSRREGCVPLPCPSSVPHQSWWRRSPLRHCRTPQDRRHSPFLFVADERGTVPYLYFGRLQVSPPVTSGGVRVPSTTNGGSFSTSKGDLCYYGLKFYFYRSPSGSSPVTPERKRPGPDTCPDVVEQ